MKDFDINVPYYAYAEMGEREKFEIDFVINYSNLEEKDYFSETPLEDRPFRDVKALMAAFSGNDAEEFAKVLFSMPDYDEKKMMNAPAWKSILSIQAITNNLINLINIENEMLTSKVPDNKYAGQIEQIDFSMFDGEYVQTRELADKDITKFEAIRNLPYKNCLIELIYRQKESDLEKLILKTQK